MGLPKLVLEFTKKAENVIERSARGIVLLLLKDATRTQIVSAYSVISEVVASDWTTDNYKCISLAFMGKPSMVIAVRGVISEEVLDIDKSIPLFENIKFDYFACPECSSEGAGKIATWFDTEKKKKFRKGKAVLAKQAADSYAVINFATDNISILWEGSIENISPGAYTARIAGMLAGLPLTRSSTYFVLDEVVDIKQHDNPDAEIDAGKMIIVYDGEKFKIGRGVTSLTTASETAPEDFKKIKLVEAADIIRGDILETFEDNYVGQLNNTYENKNMFLGAVLTYLKTLEGTLVDGSAGYEMSLDVEAYRKQLKDAGIDTSEMKDIDILKANSGALMALTGHLSLLDAMEELNFKIRL